MQPRVYQKEGAYKGKQFVFFSWKDHAGMHESLAAEVLFWKQRYAGGCAAKLRPGAAPAGKVTLSLLGAVATHSNMLFAYFSPLCSFNLVYFSHSKIPAYWALIWNLVNVGCSVFWDLFSKSPFFAVQSYSFAWSNKWRNQKYWPNWSNWSNLTLAESRNLFFY